MGEEGVVLKEIAHPPLLGRQVDFGLAVKEDPAVQDDSAPVRPQQPGNTAQAHALSAAGGPQQGQ